MSMSIFGMTTVDKNEIKALIRFARGSGLVITFLFIVLMDKIHHIFWSLIA